MYFKPFLIDKILSGDKTQTRRLVKPGDDSRRPPLPDGISDKIDLVVHKGRVKWEVGKDYAVCPGRGKPVAWYCGTNLIMEDRQYTPGSVMAMAIGGFIPLRIRITAIRREDVRTISDDDIFAEGFGNYYEFMDTWTSFHDVPALPVVQEYCNRRDYLESALDKRPADRYTAWALSFEVHHEQ